MARTAILICLPLLAFGVACSGGPAGPSSTTGPSPEPPGPGTESPPNTRDNSGAGREAPPASGDPAPPSSDPNPAGSSTTTACFTCDASYLCAGVVDGAALSGATLSFKTVNHLCVLSDANSDKPSDVAYSCGGKVSVGGVGAGTWQPLPGGGFSFSGKDAALTCRLAPAPTPGGK